MLLFAASSLALSPPPVPGTLGLPKLGGLSGVVVPTQAEEQDWMGEPDVVPAAFEAAPALSEEEVASRLRGFRTATNRQLLDIAQLDDYDDELAATIRQTADFAVPTTMPEAVITFFSQGTPQFIVAMLLACTAGRLSLGTPTPTDALVAVAVFAFWCVQEWWIHDKLLHSEDEWFGEQVHGGHHLLPYYHVSLDGVGLAAAWFSAVAAIAAAAAAFLSVPLAPCLTAVGAYTLCGGLYEGSHFLAHTRVPMRRGGLLSKMRRHHMMHHIHNDGYWLAFIIPEIDRLFGTGPKPADVPRATGRRPDRRAEAM